MIVVADTTPINYLIVIGYIDILESLYGSVVIPPAVQDEMLDPLAPASVRLWISNPPHWLEVRTPSRINAPLDPNLDDGEREAISLAQQYGARVLLIDEILGRREAQHLGIKVIGTVGILKEAHERGLLDFQEAVVRLQSTSFQIAASILKSVSDSLKS